MLHEQTSKLVKPAQILGQSIPQQRLFLPEEVAVIIRFHAESVRRAIRQGRISAIKTGRHWKIPAAEVARIQVEGV